ncbi:MAG: diacylglycerol kinase family protein [Rhodopirellula sp.]|nr:diacylglycerol kinase family protein [Rhodopirellula sp.]
MKQSSGDEPAGFFTSRCVSFRHAFRGLGFALRSEIHVRIHLVATLAVIGAGLYFDLSINEWCSVSLAIGLVIASEILNTAIERLVDIVRPEHDAAAGQVKDLASAATLVAAFAAAVIGLLIFGPHFLNL